jgi:hypothetical protein
MNPPHEIRRVNIGIGRSVQPPLDEDLNLDVRPALELKSAKRWICGEVIAQSLLNGHRVSVVALDQVRIVAVHRAEQFHNATPCNGVKHAAKRRRFLQQPSGNLLQTSDSSRGKKRLQSLRSAV